jgi:hypothetical protein
MDNWTMDIDGRSDEMKIVGIEIFIYFQRALLVTYGLSMKKIDKRIKIRWLLAHHMSLRTTFFSLDQSSTT